MANLPNFNFMLQQFKSEVDMTEVLSNFSSSASPEYMFSYLWNNPDAHIHLTPCLSTGQKYEEGAMRHGELAEEKYRTNEFDEVLKHYNLGLMLAPHPRVYAEGNTRCDVHGDPILQSDQARVSSQRSAASGASNVFKEETRENVNLRETELQTFCERRDQSARPKVFSRSQTTSDSQVMHGSDRPQDLHGQAIHITDESKDTSERPRIFVKSEFSLREQPSKSDGELPISSQFFESGEGADALTKAPISSQGDRKSVEVILEDVGDSLMMDNIEEQGYDPGKANKDGHNEGMLDNRGESASASITELTRSQGDQRSTELVLADGSESLVTDNIGGQEISSGEGHSDGDNVGMLENEEIANGRINDVGNIEQGQDEAENESSIGTAEYDERNLSLTITESDDPQSVGNESQHSVSSHDSSLADLVERMKRMVTPIDIFKAELEQLGGFGAQHEGLGGFEAQNEGLGGVEAQHEDLGGIEAQQGGLGGNEAQHEGFGEIEAPHEGLGEIEAPHEGLGGIEAQHEGLGGKEAQHEGLGGNETQHEGLGGNEAQHEGLGRNEAQHEGSGGIEAQHEGLGEIEAQQGGLGGVEARQEDLRESETRQEGPEALEEGKTGPEAREEDSKGAGAQEGDSIGAGTRESDSIGAGAREGDSIGAGAREGDSRGAGAWEGDSRGAGAWEGDSRGAGAWEGNSRGAGGREEDSRGSKDREEDSRGSKDREEDSRGSEAQEEDLRGSEARGAVEQRESFRDAGGHHDSRGAGGHHEGSRGVWGQRAGYRWARGQREGYRGAAGQQEGSRETWDQHEGSRGAWGRREGSKGAGGRRDGSRGAGGRRDGSRGARGQRDGSRGAGGRRDGSRGAGGQLDGSRGARGRHEGWRGGGRRESPRGSGGKNEGLRGPGDQQVGLRRASGEQEGMREAFDWKDTRKALGEQEGLRAVGAQHKSLRVAEARQEGVKRDEARQGVRGPEAGQGVRGPEAGQGVRGPEAGQGVRGPEAGQGVRGPEAGQGVKGPEAGKGVRGPEAELESVRGAEAGNEGRKGAKAQQEGIRRAEAGQEDVREAVAGQESVRGAVTLQEDLRETEARQMDVREDKAQQEDLREAKTHQEAEKETEVHLEGMKRAEAHQKGVRGAEAQHEGMRGAEGYQEDVKGPVVNIEGVREAEVYQEDMRMPGALQEGGVRAEAYGEGMGGAEAHEEGVGGAEAHGEGVGGAETHGEEVGGAKAHGEGMGGAEVHGEGVGGAEAHKEGGVGAEVHEEGIAGREAQSDVLRGDELHGSFSTESAPSADFTSESRGEYESLDNVARDVDTEQNADSEESTLVESQEITSSDHLTPQNYKALVTFYELRASFLYRMKVYEKSLFDIDMALKHGCSNEARLILQRMKRNCENDIAKGSKRKSKERGLIFSYNTPEPPILQDRSPVIPVLSSAVKLAYSSRAGRYLVANRDIRPGEVLGVEEPFCATINMNEHTSYCSNCLRRCATIIPCPNCSLVMFCSEDCLMRDSSHPHWPICNILSTVLLLRFSPSGLLAVHLFLKFKFSQMEKLTERLLKEEAELPPNNRGMNEQGIYDSTNFRTVFHLPSNMHTRSPEELFDLTAEAFCITKLLMQSQMFFMNERNMPFEPDNDDVVMTGAVVFRLLMKLRSSTSSIGEFKVVVDKYEKSWVENAGYGVYPAMSLLNHSCHPTASLYNHGKTSVLYSVRSISKGQPITISYGAKYRLLPKEFRSEILKENYYFDCDCEACREDWYPDFDNVFELRCVKCERAIDMTRGFCSSCQIYYREGRDYGGDPPYNFFQVRDQITQAATNCKRIQQKILRLGSTVKDRHIIISAIEFMEKYVRIPCTVLFDAQDALRVSFEREGSYVYIKDHKISNQRTTHNVINSAWTGRRDITFEQSPKKSPKKRNARRQGAEPRDFDPDLDRSFNYRLLSSDSRDRNL